MTHSGTTKMQKAGFTLVCLFIVVHSETMAQDERAAANENPLQPLEYLVGGIWKAEGEITGFGKYSASRSYRWALGGKFIEQQHVMRVKETQFETKGIIGWNPDTKAIVAWGFGSDGGITTTSANTATAGAELRLEGNRVGPFHAGPIRATFRKVNENEFVELAEIKKGDQWEQMFSFRFKRTPAN